MLFTLIQYSVSSISVLFLSCKIGTESLINRHASILYFVYVIYGHKKMILKSMEVKCNFICTRYIYIKYTQNFLYFSLMYHTHVCEIYSQLVLHVIPTSISSLNFFISPVIFNILRGCIVLPFFCSHRMEQTPSG